MISWRTQVYSTPWQYRTARYDTLLDVEEGGAPKTFPYVDNQLNPAPTIGVGFNLRVPENLDEVLRAIGFDLGATGPESDYISRIRAAVNRGYASGDNDTLRKNLDQVMKDWSEDTNVFTHNDKPKRAIFTLYTGEVRPVFDILALKDYEPQLTDWATLNGLGTIPNSPERIALLSLVWNSKDVNPHDGIPDLLGPNLTKAIQTGNRAEAWYEIRYNTNAEGEAGVAKRRYYESELFGLYNDAGGQSPAEREADYIEVLRMYTRHRTAIVAGENRYGETAVRNMRAEAESPAGYGTNIASLTEALAPAADDLLAGHVPERFGAGRMAA